MSEFKKYDIIITRYYRLGRLPGYYCDCLWDGHVTVYKNTLSCMLNYAQGCFKLTEGNKLYRPTVKLVNRLSNGTITYKIIKTPIKYKIRKIN